MICKRCREDKLIRDYYYDSCNKTHRKECKECTKKYEQGANHSRSGQKREYYKKDKAIRKKKRIPRKSELKRKYNLTLEEYDVMVTAQHGVCAICGNSSFQDLGVDHNHKTRKVRGLLCTVCNTGIGFFHENITVLENAISYLRKHS